ncbi:MAG: hypothetical protein Q8J78_06755 [Moraxellaceae bacterium]|nr:hypothetical protein [Moraxellaceae bacterium]
MSIVVTVEPGVGFVATARQGGREYIANGSAPEIAVKIAAAGLVSRYPTDIAAERRAPNLWIATEKTRR